MFPEEDAFRLSSVPLDTSLSLETLRGILKQSRYTARALQHSRKLLILYLAGQQNCELFSSLPLSPPLSHPSVCVFTHPSVCL